ncbi:MAG: sigma-70 family RNA polymerase sigma factor [Isosphaeraceae bacterium]
MSAGSSVARDIQTLFDSGTASGLSDRELLERFTSGGDAAAESAFEVLVLRHGPMVLQVCRNALGDATDAQDAFQATFLVLVRRCGSIRRLDSVGGWLYGVACRVAARARVDAARRRAAERRGALRVVEAVDSNDRGEPEHAEFSPALQEEVRRLPEKYRSVVVLCYWQGLTQEQVAAQLGCPLGTVRSRLARARDLLRSRLVRRGLAPLAGVVAAGLGASSASASLAALRLGPLPADLARSTAKAAAKVATGEALARVASGLVTSLVEHVLWSLTMFKVCRLLVACTFIGLGVLGASLWAQQPRPRRPRPRPAAQAERGALEKPKDSGNRKFGPAHVVEPPDVLVVEVLDALPGRPISGERLVRPDGTISLGYYGDVQVAGLTVPEIKEKVIQHLRKYLTDVALGIAQSDPYTGKEKFDPSSGKPVMLDPGDSDMVFVDVTAYNSANYYIEGDVVTAGKCPITGNDTVLDAIHYAGGLLPSADGSQVKLIRSYPKGSPVQVLPIDYEQVTMGTDGSTNYQLLPNDRLVVPRDPKYTPSSATADRSQPRRRQAASDSRYFPGLAAETIDEQRSPLRAVERRLSEVEKKLDTIIERMDRAGRKARDKAPANAEREPERTPRDEREPE